MRPHGRSTRPADETLLMQGWFSGSASRRVTKRAHHGPPNPLTRVGLLAGAASWLDGAKKWTTKLSALLSIYIRRGCKCIC